MPTLLSHLKHQSGLIIILVLIILSILSIMAINLFEQSQWHFRINEAAIEQIQTENTIQSILKKIDYNNQHQACFVDAMLLRNPRRISLSWLKHYACHYNVNEHPYYVVMSVIGHHPCATIFTSKGKVAIDFIKVLLFNFSGEYKDIHLATYARNSSLPTICSSMSPVYALGIQAGTELDS